jgi:hypothetical protein
MAFYTEKRTEKFLTYEIRCLTISDDTNRHVSGTCLMWHYYDFIVEYCKFSEQELIKMTLNSCIETELEFDVQLHELVGYIALEYRKGLCLDEFHQHMVDFPKLLPAFNVNKAKLEDA